jgi:GNAT superfamily N-acetyltransferase
MEIEKYLKFEAISKENFDEIVKIKHTLFPESNSDEDYYDFFENRKPCEYFLVYFKNEPCAITGWYDFDGLRKDAFMGWFGVLPHLTRNGIGSAVFDFTFERVKKHGYNYFRVYTDEKVNFASTILYKKKNMIEERYSFNDKLGNCGRFVVYTKVIKSLGKEFDLWNNRPLEEDFNYSEI